MTHTLYLYNTPAREKQAFTPEHEKEVHMYCCGPTVYNYAHIGNLRTYVFEDFLRRTLRSLGYTLRHVVNVTDVGHLVSDADTGEDKMEAGARREKKSVWDIARYYTDVFMRHIDMLHIERAELWPRATDHIDEMIALVRTLEEKGYTYRTADGVYFDTAVFAPYCTYAGLDPESLQAGSRVDMGEKRNATDFALWKFSPAGRKRQMEWDSPWGVGFPGWHIECSAMALKYLDQPVDIHCGGTDHIRVHHTNEVAQVEAATDTRFVNYWLHGEFLVMKNAKMAKSEGNFVTLDTLVERGYSPLAFRMLCCTAHYRSPLTFTWEALDGAAQSLVTMQLEVANAVADVLGEMQHDAQADALEAVREDTGITGPFFEALCDDLNVPRAIGCVWDVIRHQDIPARKKCAALQCFDEVLGLDLLQLARRRTVTHVAQPDGGDITIIAYRDMQQQEIDETVAAIRERTQARAQKDFARADTIRDELAAANKQLQDLPGKKTQCSVL